MAVGFVGLDDTVPADNSFIGDGAEQIRNVKQALNTAFPAVTGEITKPSGYGPVEGSTQPTQADYSQLFTDMEDIVNPAQANSTIIPIGTIVMWSGNDWNETLKQTINNIGWYECDGGQYNGRVTPNLVNRFVKGWDDQGNTGGNVGTPAAPSSAIETSTSYEIGTTTEKAIAKNYTLVESNIPAHRHNLTLGLTGPESDQINPATYFINSATDTIASAAQAGSFDGEYNLAYDPTRRNVEANTGQSSKYGNDNPDALDLGLTSDQFEHSHQLDATGLEPANEAVIFLMYCGVV